MVLFFVFFFKKNFIFVSSQLSIAGHSQGWGTSATKHAPFFNAGANPCGNLLPPRSLFSCCSLERDLGEKYPLVETKYLLYPFFPSLPYLRASVYSFFFSPDVKEKEASWYFCCV